MSATAQAGAGVVPAQDVPVDKAGSAGAKEPGHKSHKVRNRLLIAFGIYLAGLIALIVIYGFKGTRNKTFKPQNEFKLESWIPIHIGPIDLSINKAVAYLAISAFGTEAAFSP